MKWAVVGSGGMLGQDLLSFLISQGELVEGFHRNNLNPNDSFTNLAARFAGFDILVNCVAYTDVDKAEIEPSESFFTNALVPYLLAEIASSVGARLIHISTDYVFDGNSEEPYSTRSPKNPLSTYGQTKSIGEDLVLSFDNCQVVRTSWLYGAHGQCFPRKVARKLLDGEDVSVVNDQFGSPTYTIDLADFIYRLGRFVKLDSIWHGVSGGGTSWFEFAKEVAVALDLMTCKADLKSVSAASYEKRLVEIGTKKSPAAANRPAYGVLQPSSIDGFAIPDWRQSWSRASKIILADLI